MEDVSDPTPNWRDVHRQLRHEIDAGRREPGSSLPTIAALAAQARLSKHGARCVLEKLREEGRVQSWHGKGYRVAAPRLRLSVHHRRPAFHEQVRALGYTPNSELCSGRRQGLPQAVARRVNRRAGTKVLRTETLRRVNGLPVALSIDYFLPENLHELAETVSKKGSISRSLAAHGVPHYERHRTSIDVRMPTAHEALVLEIPRGQPVYATFGANLTPEGELVQISQGVLRADCVTYEV